MSMSLFSLLRRHRLKLFEFKCRQAATGRPAGFVLDTSPSLVLFHRLDFDTFTLNGFTALPLADISAWRCFNRRAHWQLRAVERFALVPSDETKVPLASFRELLSCPTLARRLVAIHRTRVSPDVYHVGLVERVTERELTMQDLNCNAD